MDIELEASIYCFLAGAALALVSVAIVRIFFPHKIIDALRPKEEDVDRE